MGAIKRLEKTLEADLSEDEIPIWFFDEVRDCMEEIQNAPIAYAVREIKTGEISYCRIDEESIDTCILLALNDGKDYEKITVKLLPIEVE